MPTSRDVNEIKSQETIDQSSPLRRSSRIARGSPARTIVTRRTSNTSEDNSEIDVPARRTRRSKSMLTNKIVKSCLISFT